MHDEYLDDKISDRLMQWEDAFERGVDLSAQELCGDAPEIASELDRRIGMLRKMNRYIPAAAQGESTVKWRGRLPRKVTFETVFEEFQFHDSGGLGVVLKATDGVLRRDVAVKFIKEEIARDPSNQRRLKFEAETTARLDHPGIVPLYGLGSDDRGNPCYAMRLIRGESLRDAIVAYHQSPPNEEAFRGLLRRFISVCNTIAYAHSRGILHRDLTPKNVMIGAYQETLVVDWGLAKAIGKEEGVESGDASTTETTAASGSESFTRGMVGTPGFVSPEQALGERVSPASDVYSLGAMLYVILTGYSPTRSLAPGEFMARVHRGEFPRPAVFEVDVPRALRSICDKAMAVKPEERYSTPLDLANDVDRWIADEPVSAYKEDWSPRLARWTRHHRSWVQVGVAALLVITMISVSASLFIRSSLRREALARTRLEVDRAIALATQGRVSEGMLWLSRALRNAPSDAIEMDHAIRANLANWSPSIPELVLDLELEDGIKVLAYSPDGKSIIAGGQGHSARIWNADTRDPIGRPLEHALGTSIAAVAFSPNGKLALTGGSDGTAQLWDAATGKRAAPPFRHNGEVRAVAFSPDGRQVLTGCFDKSARLWDIASGKEVATLLGHDDKIQAVAFSHDGTRIATGSEDGTARLWDRVGNLIAICRHEQISIGVPGYVWDLAFSPDDRLLATASDDHTAMLWDALTGESVGTPMPHKIGVWRVGFTPDSKSLVTVTYNGWELVPPRFSGQVWDVVSQQPKGPPLSHDGAIWALALSPDGTKILIGSDDEEARLWDAAAGKLLGEPMKHKRWVNAAAFHPKDNCRFATGSDNLRLWRMQKPVIDRVFVDPSSGGLIAHHFTPGGTKLWIESGDDKQATFTLWDIDAGHRIGLGIKVRGIGSHNVLSHSGKMAVTSFGAEARIWNATTGKLIGVPLVHGEIITSLAINTDETMIVTGGKDNTARLWDASTGKAIGPPLPHELEVGVVTFSPDSRPVFTGGNDVRLWDASTGKPLGPPIPCGGTIECVAFRSDGGQVATGSTDHIVRIWDVSSGGFVNGKSVVGHERFIHAIAYSSDGSRIITGSSDKTARLWDSSTGEAVGLAMSHGAPVRQVAFSPDGNTLLTGSEDGIAQFWDAETTLAIGPPLRHGGGKIAIAFSSDGTAAMTGGLDHRVRRWRLNPPLDWDRERIESWVRMLTRREFTSGDDIRFLELNHWRKLREEFPSEPGD